MSGALLFDLDDTLVVEGPAAVAAFEATARAAATCCDVDTTALAVAARASARRLWRSSPVHPYCSQIGISSSEGLWCRFDDDSPQGRWLREWSPNYRRETWRLALADQGVDDDGLAAELGVRFGAERRARHEVFPDVGPALQAVSGEWALGLVTNGASSLQREKLTVSGLGGWFSVAVVSGELGVGKPDAAIFDDALARLGCDPARAVMVGDSVPCDIHGALAAGLGAVWVNRFGQTRDEDHPAVPEVATLADLPAALRALANA